MNEAKEVLRKHLGPARMEDAINRLAKHIENGALLASTDPVAFLDAVTTKLEAVQALVVWSQEPCLSRDSRAYSRAMNDLLNKMKTLGLVKHADKA